MTPVEQGYLLLFADLGDDIRPLTAAKLQALRQFASVLPPAELFSQPVSRELLVRLGMAPDFAQEIVIRLNRRSLLGLYLENAACLGIHPLTMASADYPQVWFQRLKQAAPAVLFMQGDRSLLQKRCMALVGSRRLRPVNVAFAERVGRMAALEGYVLVSGNARGADRTAQQACLDAGGSVISIVPEPLDGLVPQARQLLICTEGYHIPFSNIRAVTRNRLIHSLGDFTLVAQTGNQSGGTWSGTVENLSRHYSPVFVFDDHTDGTYHLIAQGADPVQMSFPSLQMLSQAQASLF